VATTTIAAIATPPGKGGVGIVRLSGPQAEAILGQIVVDWPAAYPSHKLRLSRILDPDGRLIDESLAVIMRGPHSYTGEDVVEFQCHGGPIILRRVLEAALSHGARTAGPGEFTQRAFLNGRLDLTQAEAVADLVNATSASAHKLAIEHLQGRLGATIERLIEAIAEAAVLVEAAIDFSHEEHVYQIEREEVRRRIDAVYAELVALRERFDEGRRQREGVRVVILGPTNAGKSTLFNALHGTDRAIVTEIAGTTRDFLEEEILLGGVALRLVDTAGLRLTEDRVEAIGIERSRALGRQADLIVWVLDASIPLGDDDRRELEALLAEQRPVVIVANKADLPSGLSKADEDFLSRFTAIVPTALGAPDRPTGFERLADVLTGLATELTHGEGVLLSRARHLECVLRAISGLERVSQALEAEMEHEFLALDLREVLDALGDITGRISTDDILNRIFCEFCVGK
jgi:tRNA modification GTPase